MKLTGPTQCTVSGALSFVLRLSKIFGLAPVKFQKVHSGWRIHVSHSACLYGKIFVSLICFMIFISLTLEVNGSRHLSIHFKTNSDAVACIGSVTAILLSLLAATFFGFRRMNCVVSSLAQLHKINTELIKYGSPTTFKPRLLVLSMCSFVGVCLVLITQYFVTMYFVMLENNGLLTHFLYFSFYLAIFMNKLLLMQISLILVTVPTSLHHLNDCLNDLLRKIRKKYTIDEFLETGVTVKHLRTLYASLCDVIKQLDDAHGVIQIILIPHFLANLVISFYNLITGVLIYETYLYPGITQMSWVLVHISNMILIIEPCHLTYEQVDIIKRVISQLLLFTPHEHHEIIHELELFYNHLINDVVYTPMGIFYLNRTVIVTVIGSITTYLVVMVEL